MPGISSTRAAAWCAAAHWVSHAFMVSSRSVWGAVKRSASVSSSLFRPCVPSSNRYPCTTSTTRGRVRIPRMAQRVKNAASVVCVTTRS